VTIDNVRHVFSRHGVLAQKYLQRTWCPLPVS